MDILVGEERVIDNTDDDDEFITDNEGTSTLIDEWLAIRDALTDDDDEEDADTADNEDTTSQPADGEIETEEEDESSDETATTNDDADENTQPTTDD